MIAINKWDRFADQTGLMAELREKAERLLPQVRRVPV